MGKTVELFVLNIMKAGESFENPTDTPLYQLHRVKSAIPDFLIDLKKVFMIIKISNK